jgi:hypothetical protein
MLKAGRSGQQTLPSSTPTVYEIVYMGINLNAAISIKFA